MDAGALGGFIWSVADLLRGDYKQFGRTGDVLWSWLREKMAEPMSEGIMGYTGTVDLNIHIAQAPSPRV